MSKDEIKKIEGVWTEEEVKQINAWASSENISITIKESLENAQVQSKIIERMAIVEPQNLKIPFTYIIE